MRTIHTIQPEPPFRFLLVNFADGSFSTVPEDSITIEEILNQESFQMMSCKDRQGRTMLLYWFEADPCDPEDIEREAEIVGRAMMLHRIWEGEGMLNDGIYKYGINVGDPANPPYDYEVKVDQ